MSAVFDQCAACGEFGERDLSSGQIACPGCFDGDPADCVASADEWAAMQDEAAWILAQRSPVQVARALEAIDRDGLDSARTVLAARVVKYADGTIELWAPSYFEIRDDGRDVRHAPDLIAVSDSPVDDQVDEIKAELCELRQLVECPIYVDDNIHEDIQ